MKGKGWRKNERRTIENEGKTKAGRKRERQRLGERPKDKGWHAGRAKDKDWAKEGKTKDGRKSERQRMGERGKDKGWAKEGNTKAGR